jgi:uncharacterized protein (TIGR01777 family)
VIHLAGENIAAKRWTARRKAELRDSRIASVTGLKRGLEAVHLQPKLFLSASASGIYGDRDDEWLPETASPGNDFLACLCRDWEKAAASVPAERCVQARFAVVLSREGGFLSRVAPIFRLFGASRLGSGRQWMSWIHITDLVEALVRILREETWRGPVNITSPRPVTNAEMTAALRASLHTFPAPPVPRLALRLLYGELADALLGSQRMQPERLLQGGFQWRFEDVHAALADLLPSTNDFSQR